MGDVRSEMEKVDRELRAMRIVAKELLKLTPEKRQRVMDALLILYDVPRIVRLPR